MTQNMESRKYMTCVLSVAGDREGLKLSLLFTNASAAITVLEQIFYYHS